MGLMDGLVVIWCVLWLKGRVIDFMILSGSLRVCCGL